jgi:hypothetical protein
VKHYPVLARALLDSGDSATSVAEFLQNDYGLDREQTKAAIILARHLHDELEAEGVAAARPRLRAHEEPRCGVYGQHAWRTGL